MFTLLPLDVTRLDSEVVAADQKPRSPPHLTTYSAAFRLRCDINVAHYLKKPPSWK